MFLNCLFLGPTVIDLMFIVHVDKMGLKLKKNWDADLGGSRVVSDIGHPSDEGGGGSKKGKFLGMSFMDGPKEKSLPIVRNCAFPYLKLTRTHN